MISLAIVAENSSVRRAAGVAASNVSSSSRKTEVEHLVGLVQHHHGKVAQAQPAAGEVVAQPPRRADDDVRGRPPARAPRGYRPLPPMQERMRAPV